MKRRLLTVVAVALVMLLCISAGSRDGAKDQAGSTGRKVVLQYADWDKFDTTFIDKWNAAHPDIQVEFTAIPDNGEKMTKVDILAMSGDLDIMPMSDAEEFIRMKNGVLAPISDYITEAGIDMKRDFGAFEEWVRYNGVYYCLPLRASLQVVYYNMDMFDAAGIPYPKDDWTWDEYIDTAKKLTKGSGQSKVYGAYTHTFGGDWATVAVQGANWYTGTGQSNIKAPAFVKGLEVRKTLDDGGFQMPFSQITAVKTMPNSEFFGGKAAMAMAGSWMVRDMKNKEKFPFQFRVGIAYIPRYDNTKPGQRISMSCSALGIPANSKHKKEAWEFLRYYIQQNSATIGASGNVPCYIPAWNDELVNTFIKGSGLHLEQGKVFFNSKATVSTSKILGTAMAMYNQLVNEQTPLYFNGEKSLNTVLNDIESLANREIAAEK
jgi:multiple sugar transport system substrate-binding protein